MDLQMLWWAGHEGWRKHESNPYRKGQDEYKWWDMGNKFARNVFFSKQGKFRGRFSEPREKGELE